MLLPFLLPTLDIPKPATNAIASDTFVATVQYTNAQLWVVANGPQDIRKPTAQALSAAPLFWIGFLQDLFVLVDP